MATPLAGIRVLEFSQVIAAPFAGQLLAELGASVIKVEPPEGESWRHQAAFAPGESKSFQSLNRGKRAVTLRLDNPRARELVQRLVRTIDVVLINYRPDVPAKFGIDYETLGRLNPQLIYADLTAFGRIGPWALRPGYDGVVQAVSGLLAGEAKLRPDGSPATIATTAIADYATGMVLADAIVTALLHRARTGEGQFVACSLLATALNLQGDLVMERPAADAERNALRARRRKAQQAGVAYDRLVAERTASRASADAVYERCWLVLDGAIAIAAELPAERIALGRLCGFDPAAGALLAAERISAWSGARTRADALTALTQAKVPAVDVLFGEELAEDAQARDNTIFAALEHEQSGAQTAVTPLLRFATPAPPPRPSPAIGRDTDGILAELGYSAAEVAELRSAGAIGGAR